MQESFAFDPAGNMLDTSRAPTDTVQSHAGVPVYTYRRTTGVLDNLLREYAGTHYSYDAYGNLSERLRNGVRSRFTWDGFDRLIQYEDERVQVTFYYDALNRRQMKDSRTRYRTRVQETKQWNEQRHAQQDREQDCGLTLYGWSGDTLAWESRNGRTTHYLYEPESFVPLAQAVSHQRISLHAQPVYGGHYDIEQDPLWTAVMEPAPVEALAWYQVDHLGTPQELTDEAGELAWSAQYKAWGEAKEVISEAANRAGIKNPLRFQGQYFDHETGLHYNRHRYYDPEAGRFISQDPIGLIGGNNFYQYAPNPIEWIDPLGLAVGHHLVPRSVWKDEGLPQDTRRVFDKATTGPIPGGHGYSKEHQIYNGAVKEKYEKWKFDNNICCPNKMTPAQAEDFVQKVRESRDPRIRIFNHRIFYRIATHAYRRGGPLGSGAVRGGNE